MTITIPDLGHIAGAAREFIAQIGSRRVFAFYGSMGAGKTTFIKAICESLGVDDVITSPTFAIVNEYTAAQGDVVYHFDFYRINKIAEALDIGFFDYVDSGELCLMEWPENIEEILPEETLRVHITVRPDGSRLLSW